MLNRIFDFVLQGIFSPIEQIHHNKQQRPII